MATNCVWITNIPLALIQRDDTDGGYNIKFREMNTQPGDVDIKTKKPYAKYGRTAEILGFPDDQLVTGPDGRKYMSCDRALLLHVPKESESWFKRMKAPDYTGKRGFVDLVVPTDEKIQLFYRQSPTATELSSMQVSPDVFKKSFELTRYVKDRQLSKSREGSYHKYVGPGAVNEVRYATGNRNTQTVFADDEMPF